MSSERDLAADLAAEIRAAVGETASPAPSAVEPALAAVELKTARSALDRALAHVTPAIPEASRLARSKRLALRVLRFLWRDQAAFNMLTLEALQALLEAERGRLIRVEREVEAFRAYAARTAESLERRVSGFSTAWERRAAIQDARLGLLESGASARLPAASPVPTPQGIPPGVYSLFEERFRGSPQEITVRQRDYLELLHGLPGPVLDVGCGRGELLRLLAKEGIAASGVEINPIAVGQCREEGLVVEQGDALAALAARPDASLGAVVALQVVEHWPAETIFAFLREARRCLAPGGLLIAETINIDTLSAWKTFYLDPSHVRPVPAEALRFLAESAGFADARVDYRSALPAGERLEESSENDAKLNRLLFGPQDYALVARVPQDEAVGRKAEGGRREE